MVGSKGWATGSALRRRRLVSSLSTPTPRSSPTRSAATQQASSRVIHRFPADGYASSKISGKVTTRPRANGRLREDSMDKLKRRERLIVTAVVTWLLVVMPLGSWLTGSH